MTADSINTEHVYALVVGIEKYKGGSEWDLNGPAQDALNFANWLLDRGVKSEHIQLFLSPLDRNVGVIEDAKAKGLNPLRADRNSIDYAIRSSLVSEGNRGDLLHVFWGGHGIVTKTDATTRRLFFADTDNISKWNLDFSSLIEALRTFAHSSGFKQQNFWIDACANTFYQGLYETIGAEAAGSKITMNGEQGNAEQFVLFAVGEYEVATNESAEGTGRFSRAVLDELQKESLLPDMKSLAERLQADFLEKKQSQPVYFWYKGRGYEVLEDRLNVTFPISGERDDSVASGSMRTSFTLGANGQLTAVTNTRTKVKFEGFTGGVSIFLLDRNKRPIWASDANRYGVDGCFIGNSNRNDNWSASVPSDILRRVRGYSILQQHDPKWLSLAGQRSEQFLRWLNSDEGKATISTVVTSAAML